MDTLNADFLRHLKEVFDLCDENRSGVIPVDRLKDLGREHLGGDEQEMVHLVECLDPKQQGYITFNDFCRGVAQVVRGTTNLVSADPDCCVYIEQTSDEVDISMSRELALRAESPTDSALATSDVSRGSPDLENKGSSPSFSDGEERFECDVEDYGVMDVNQISSKPSLSSDSFRSTSSTGSTGSIGRNREIPNQFPQRNSWLRTSLRRSSGSSKRMSSDALARELFSSGTTNGHNSSRRSSISYGSDDMFADQQTVDDLSEKVQSMEHQIATLTDNLTSNKDLCRKVKQENMTLMDRIHGLEEHIRELEIRSEARIREEERRLKETLAKQEREKSMEIEQYTSRLYSLQQEHIVVKEEVIKLRNMLDRLKQEKLALEEKHADAISEISILREDHQKLQEMYRRERDEFQHERNANNQIFEEMSHELEDLRRYKKETELLQRARSPSLLELPSQYQELEKELRNLRDENRALREANEELQAQLLSLRLDKGRTLIDQSNSSSLAAEFNTLETLSKEQLVSAVKGEREDNLRLRAYIDGILLNIIENHPQLLEVRTPN